jgi:hypothetical protein
MCRPSGLKEGVEMMKHFNEKEIEVLKDMVEQWWYEGFVSDLSDIHKSILTKLEIDFDE